MEWVRQYMTMHLPKAMLKNYAKGYAEGLELGERQFAKLISILFKQNKIDEIKLVINDVDARHKMFQKYHITDENI